MTSARVEISPLHATTREIEPPADLLEHLGAGGFAWFGNEVSFVTGGVAATLDPGDAAAFLAAVEHHSPADAPRPAGPIAVGALPFAGAGRLVVPARVIGIDRAGRAWSTRVAHGVATRAEAVPQAAGYSVEAVSTIDAWQRAVGRVLHAVGRGDVTKVVLAREVGVEADRPFDIARVLRELRRTQPGCFVFADDGFVGATPELLVRRTGDVVTCRPMAGTVARGADASSLVASRKDGAEHDAVASAVVTELRRWCSDVIAAEAVPAEFADVTHLVTHVEARLRDDATNALDLARALHPTPAVAGTPRNAALAMIRSLEPTDRGKYAGPVGWVAPNGDGEFAVALRCAQIDGSHARLHAGAGIVAGSDAVAEWDETSAKFEPMLRALVRP